ncbi:hypothetical protein [Thermomonas sp.]|uniref:hypothetical protein n=1 Tax=Thermomonas sp. TaxID=1971895 RepID=UPI003D1156D7
MTDTLQITAEDAQVQRWLGGADPPRHGSQRPDGRSGKGLNNAIQVLSAHAIHGRREPLG